MYKYETHMHTAPVSKCARASVYDSLIFYKQRQYDGVFITNHFLDGNFGGDPSASYAERLAFYLSAYEEGASYAEKLGIKVFFGVESSYKGTDFLLYGLAPDWFVAHPEIMDMKKSEQLSFFRSEGALVIQAHPFRQAGYIDHVRLFPDRVDGFEVFNANRTDTENKMAELYADEYKLLKTAGSDNHVGREQTVLAGLAFETPVLSETDFAARVRSGEGRRFIEIP